MTPRGRKVCYGSVSYRGWGARLLPGELAVDECCRHIGKLVNLYALYVCMYGWVDGFMRVALGHMGSDVTGFN